MKEEDMQPNESAPLNDIFQGLLSNPEVLQRVSSVLSSMSSGSSAPHAMTEQPRTTASDQPPSAAPAMQGINTDGLSAILSDPAMMEKLPQIMAMLRPLMASQASPKPESVRALSDQSARDNLLLALKPFLSAERRQAVDSILRLSKLGSVFQQLNKEGR